jgi:DNA-directed RNA polymerase specialized sigma24 family protein
MELYSTDQSWLAALKQGQEKANRQLFQSYFPQLVSLARIQLELVPSQLADPDDLVQSALNSFFQGLRLKQLKSSELQEIVVLKMQGYTNAEIAEQQGCVIRTIERKLKLIRTIWEQGS